MANNKEADNGVVVYPEGSLLALVQGNKDDVNLTQILQYVRRTRWEDDVHEEVRACMHAKSQAFHRCVCRRA